MSPRQIFSHSKKISWAYLLVSFLLGILFTFSLLFSKLNLPFKTLNVSNESSQEHESNDYTFTRLKGFEHIRPLISVEPKYESKRFGVLKSKLTDLLDSLKMSGTINEASVYLKELERGEWISLNGEERYRPASLMKIPLLLSYLRMAEATPGLLTQKMVYKKPDSVTITTQFYAPPAVQPGKEYTIHELLYYMVAHSDNNATWLLASKFDASVTKKLFDDFDLPEPVEDDEKFTLTPKECSVFFNAIYNVAYLSPEYSEYAAALLSNCTFDKGFTKGFPKETKMWHKFGEWRGAGHDAELHESGIVYIHDKPYLLTVMTRGKDTDKLAEVIRAISQKTYEYVSP